mgnify:CR=1 FL=1
MGVLVELEIEIEAAWPQAIDWEALATRAVAALCHVAPELANARLSASLLFSDDAEVHALNREWRGKDQPTNVLSFPMLTREDLLALPQDGPPELLGDIALALETCAREAADKGIAMSAHATHLIVHGVLHLMGFDHISDDEAEAMEALERRIMADLGHDDPYGDETR